MAVTGFFHHFGTFLLFTATILLIITCISAPVVNDIGLLKVNLGNATAQHHSKVTFGTFGFCQLNTADGHDHCSKSMVGYSPGRVMINTEQTDFSKASLDTTRALTKVMILHPISAGLAFIAFILAIGAGMFGSFLAAAVSLLAFLVTLVALICDFVMFAIVKRDVNKDPSGSSAEFSIAMWTLLASAVCSLLGTVVIFFTCCSARMHRRRTTKVENDYGTAVRPARRRRRWF